FLFLTRALRILPLHLLKKTPYASPYNSSRPAGSYLQSTPTIFVNGRRIVGADTATIARYIQYEIAGRQTFHSLSEELSFKKLSVSGCERRPSPSDRRKPGHSAGTAPTPDKAERRQAARSSWPR